MWIFNGIVDFFKNEIELNKRYYESLSEAGSERQPASVGTKASSEPIKKDVAEVETKIQENELGAAIDMQDKGRVFPEQYEQKSEESVVKEDHTYDFTRFSRHEAETIQSVLRTVNFKYIPEFTSFGLVNEAYPVIYKSRYVLFDIVIIRYENSNKPIDRLAVALAYESKGAFFRKQAIEYFESSIGKVKKSVLKQFVSYSPSAIYLKFAKVYEREREYEKAIDCFREAMKGKGVNVSYCISQIDEIRKKIEKPPRKRTTKMSERQKKLENDIRSAAISFNSGDFSNIQIL